MRWADSENDRTASFVAAYMTTCRLFFTFGATICVAVLAGCAGHPLVASRSALDNEPEPVKRAAVQTTTSSTKTTIVSTAPAAKVKTTTQTEEKTVPAPEPMPMSSGNLQPRPETPNVESVVVINTSFGAIVIELDAKAAPQTAANFEKMALQGFYNRTTFHRVIPGFMIQGGDPNTKDEDRSLYGSGGPGYTLPAEISLSTKRGAVAMARLPDVVNPRKNSSGSQFFICVVDCPHLEGGYTVFGHVIKGMDAADKIVAVNRDAKDCPIERVEMQVSVASKSKALEKAD
jgi:peptidyl-prolyl cis-trans isomerase B (cyclophilin B)